MLKIAAIVGALVSVSGEAYALDTTIPLQASFPGSPRIHLRCGNTGHPVFSVLLDRSFTTFGPTPDTVILVLGGNNTAFVAHGFALPTAAGLEIVGEVDRNEDLRDFVNYMNAPERPPISLVVPGKSVHLDTMMSAADGNRLAHQFSIDCGG
jgi:hypothetical protein